uniref:Uncharacterized protein n=1 Tax=Oryza sativa subsp. japonica TaxID=39947 RepID=Q2R4F0_ORYSJ|nr:hypothetical protein LOC_Os11g28710 [Oryza sativa Japonica Group]
MELLTPTRAVSPAQEQCHPVVGTRRLLIGAGPTNSIGTYTTPTSSRAPTARTSSPKQPPPRNILLNLKFGFGLNRLPSQSRGNTLC